MTEIEQESRDKSREFREIILNKDGKRLIDWIAEKEVEFTRLKEENQILKGVRDELFDRLTHLKELVREMVRIINGLRGLRELHIPYYEKEAEYLFGRDDFKAILEEK